MWSSIQKEHITIFLILFALITVAGYFPQKSFENSTGLAVEIPQECTFDQVFVKMVSYSQTVPSKFDVGACCARREYCVSDHTGNPECYPPGESSIDYDGDGRIESFCTSNSWIDCDQNAYQCSYSGSCSANYKWVTSGEGSVGQYVNQELSACCGDDLNEYLIEASGVNGTFICCNSPNDLVENGKCVSPPSQETLTLSEEEDTEFEGKTITLEKVSQDSIIIDVENVERIIRLDDNRLVNGILIALEDLDYDLQDQSDSEAEISVRKESRQELCTNGKDDDLDGITDGLDTDCTGESASIDSVSVSEDEVTEGEEIEVTCTLDLSGASLRDARDCVYVEIGDNTCTDIDSEEGDDELLFSCDAGLSGGDKDVKCVVDPDCNTGRSSRRTSIDVVEEGACRDLDGDGFCGVRDCNEQEPKSNYNLEETCGDEIDNNCNNLTDENCCSDDVLNGDEEEVDCGGDYCPRCDTGEESETPDSEDWDEDGLNNRIEFEAGTNPYNPDTDGDGIQDGVDPDPLEKEEGGFSILLLIFIILIVIVLGLGSIIIIRKTNKRKEKHLNNSRLVGYIRQSLKRHVPEEQIVQSLLQKGWDWKTIHEGIIKVKKGE